MNRRGFLKGLSAFIAAPAIIRAESLMPIWVPPGAGEIHCDTTRIIYDRIESGIILSDSGMQFFSYEFRDGSKGDITVHASIDAKTGDATFAGDLVCHHGARDTRFIDHISTQMIESNRCTRGSLQ